tara:strand:- start:480 stop:848 length:369 start_codon:yes stop_codon:yes gene_type:complete
MDPVKDKTDNRANIDASSTELHKILIADIAAAKIQKLLVMSYEPDLYLATVVINWKKYQVYRAPGELLREFSQLALKKHFKELGIQRTYLIHNSAYDEMIGNPAPAHSPMELKIANPDADLS